MEVAVVNDKLKLMKTKKCGSFSSVPVLVWICQQGSRPSNQLINQLSVCSTFVYIIIYIPVSDFMKLRDTVLY